MKRLGEPAHTALLNADPLWYKDAVIYQLHIKSFYDANDDGVGDLAGLLAKLDYLVDLDIDAVWLLPFYPSPRRDDGYDIADYRNIHPDYGTLPEMRRFIAAAHARGIRVITELVINHTSDQHTPGSSARAGPSRARRRAGTTCGPTMTRPITAPASSFAIPRSPTGAGRRWQAPISGTAFTRTCPT